MIRCAIARNLLTRAVLRGDEPGRLTRSHGRHCIRCQAHVASLRATRRRLAEIRDEPVELPAGLRQQVLNNLEPRRRNPGAGDRWVRAAGASMAAGLLAALWVHRRSTART